MLRRLEIFIVSIIFITLIAACGGGYGGGGGDASNGSAGGGPVTLSGKVTYDFVPAVYNDSTGIGTLAFSQTSAKPVRNATVQVLQGIDVLATSRTDDAGNYQISYSPGGINELKVVVLAETADPPIQVQDNADENAIWAIGSALDATTTKKNIHAATGWNGRAYVNANRSAAPFAVLDSMYTAAKALTALRNVSYPLLKVNWSPNNVPQDGIKSQGFIGTSHYSPYENAIYILGQDGADTDEFDDHVIVHEWAHFFQNNLSRSDSPGGPHDAGESLDPELSFGEGSATAIAAIVLNDALYVDTIWSGGTICAFGLNAETAPAMIDDPNPGALSEITVMRLLYDLVDPASGESYDQLSVGLGTLYDVLTGPIKSTEALVTIGAFVHCLELQPGVSAAAVNTLLGHYTIGPISTPWGDGDSTLRQMYTDITSFPSTLSTVLGGYHSNESGQNHYYVFAGNGNPVTVSANSASDVDLAVFQAGTRLDSADRSTSGTETLQVPTQSGKKYVVVLTGFAKAAGGYPVTLNFLTP